MVSGAVKASILFWIASGFVLFVLFGSLSSIILSIFTHQGASYHCTGRTGNRFVLSNAKLADETFWSIIGASSVSCGFGLGFLGVFVVLFVVIALNLSKSEEERKDWEETQVERQRKQLEACCTSGEKEELLGEYERVDLEDRQESVQQPQPESYCWTYFTSEWWQLLICLLLEIVCFLMAFAFFVSWMFVSRDVVFFSSTLPAKFHNSHLSFTCEAPAAWSVLNILSIVGVFGWFFMAMFILGAYLLVNRWTAKMRQVVTPRSSLPSSPMPFEKKVVFITPSEIDSFVQ